MLKENTQSIDIQVTTRYLAENSIPKENHYFFVYFITITNNNSFSVQLTKRHWDIIDSTGEKRRVDGEGVVGETPILEPGESFSYNSGCNLQSDVGAMYGYYSFINLITEAEFNVPIPRFEMMVPAKLN